MSGNYSAPRHALLLAVMAFALMGALLRAEAQEPVFSVEHGIYTEEFRLWITTTDPTAVIYYTDDGSDPRQKGNLYGGSLGISETTVVRAACLLGDTLWTPVTTATYIFPTSLLTQSNTPRGGYPTRWGKYCQITGQAVADYEMDPEMTRDPLLRPLIKEGILTLPIISLATDKDNLFSHENDSVRGGIYIYTGCPVGDGTGRGWERPVSFELMGGEQEHDLTVDCCLKLHGGHGRLPEKNPKHAFRLHFKKEYGPGKLKYPVFGPEGAATHDALVLRTFFGYSWQHWDNGQRSKAQYCRDLWARCTQARMGDPISAGQYAHLFINGIYWGMYNLCERVTDSFCKQKFGGKVEDWDVTEVDGGAGNYHAAIPTYGTIEAWNKMADLIYAQSDVHASYMHLTGRDRTGKVNAKYEPLLDVDNFIRYMLINLYGGNTDWDHHNWFAYRNRVAADCGFRFICWDTENIFINVTENLTTKNNRGCPTGMLNRLMKERLFAHRFHELAQRHLFHGGALSPEGAVATWDSLYQTIRQALYDEAARWGDYRRDVHPYTSRGALYTVDGQYQTERRRLLETYFPKRTDIFVEQLRSRSWFPKAAAPEVYVDETNVGYLPTPLPRRAALSLRGAEMYYTLDGADPVTWNNTEEGELTASARPASEGEDILRELSRKELPDTLYVKSISREGGEWSPIVTTCLVVQRPLRGDVNEDDTLDEADLAVVLDCVSRGVSDGDTWLRADLNGDGRVSIADVVVMLRLLSAQGKP